MNACPSDASLRALLAEFLTAAEVLVLTDHLDGCLRCQERLQQLTRDTTEEYWRRLQAEPGTLARRASEGLPRPSLARRASVAAETDAGQTGPYVPVPGTAGRDRAGRAGPDWSLRGDRVPGRRGLWAGLPGLRRAAGA